MIICLKSKNLCVIIKTQKAIDCEIEGTGHDSGTHQSEGKILLAGGQITGSKEDKLPVVHCRYQIDRPVPVKKIVLKIAGITQ